MLETSSHESFVSTKGVKTLVLGLVSFYESFASTVYYQIGPLYFLLLCEHKINRKMPLCFLRLLQIAKVIGRKVVQFL